MAQLEVNGHARVVEGDSERPLLWVLRDDLGLTGTKYSCLEGICGACTVLVDGTAVRSCVTPLGDAAGHSVTTVEGLPAKGRLHPVQQGFLEELGFQCGFCTSGQMVNAAGLLAHNSAPSDAEIVEAMDGNVCRCCAYPRIKRSVRRAAELARMGGRGAEQVLESIDDGGSGWVGSEDTWLARPAWPWDRQAPEDREYFELLGPGLVVVLPPEATRRQTAAGGPAWSASGGAWLHVGRNGAVTAFTGKVDVGQDNRTALTMIVADELGVPLERVRLVMGDTDVCPFDIGTFGSRSTPDAGITLRSVAMGAREALIRLAEGRLGESADRLEPADGRIARNDGESIGYGELVEGLRRVDRVGLVERRDAPRKRSLMGTPTSKLTALDVVLARRTYVLDVTRPGMLFGRILRAPSFGARLRSVVLDDARGVAGVVTVADAGFVGVAAPDRETADRAIDAIHAEWEIDDEPDEASIVPYLREHPVELQGWMAAETGADDPEALAGDVGAAFERATHRLDQTYTAAYIAHVPLETRDAVAEWDGERVTVWTGTQRPFGVRHEIAGELGIAEEDVRVIVPDTGGGFGGKHSGEAAVEAARLAREAGRPVKVRWTREEEMTWAYFRPYAVIDVRAGLDGDGTLQSWEFTNTNSGPNAMLTPYRVPNRRIRYQPADSPLRIGSYRALAATANTFARETAMDELAVAAEEEPLAFRLRHVADDRLAVVYRAVAERARWDGRDQSRSAGVAVRRGFGIAGGVEKDARVATVADVEVGADGAVSIMRLVVGFECGEIVNPGNLRNQIEGAAVMGLGGALFEAVHFENGRILTPTLKEYRVPRMSDLPEIDVVLVDRPDIPSAGAGETPITAIAPAIGNAIFAATGVRLRSMPLVPDRIPI